MCSIWCASCHCSMGRWPEHRYRSAGEHWRCRIFPAQCRHLSTRNTGRGARGESQEQTAAKAPEGSRPGGSGFRGNTVGLQQLAFHATPGGGSYSWRRHGGACPPAGHGRCLQGAAWRHPVFDCLPLRLGLEGPGGTQQYSRALHHPPGAADPLRCAVSGRCSGGGAAEQAAGHQTADLSAAGAKPAAGQSTDATDRAAPPPWN